jgi:hypothetical protein
LIGQILKELEVEEAVEAGRGDERGKRRKRQWGTVEGRWESVERQTDIAREIATETGSVAENATEKETRTERGRTRKHRGPASNSNTSRNSTSSLRTAVALRAART